VKLTRSPVSPIANFASFMHFACDFPRVSEPTWMAGLCAMAWVADVATAKLNEIKISPARVLLRSMIVSFGWLGDGSN
jgi:hypothetical protein